MFVPIIATPGWVITVVVASVTGEAVVLVDAETIAKVTRNAIITESNKILIANTLVGPDVLVEVEPY